MALLEPPSLPFEVSVVPNRDEVAVIAAGELDFASAGMVEQEILTLREAGFETIVIDLHRVTFMDSGGLHMLLRMRDLARRDGFALSMIEPSARGTRIFEITGTRSAFAWRDRQRP